MSHILPANRLKSVRWSERAHVMIDTPLPAPTVGFVGKHVGASTIFCCWTKYFLVPRQNSLPPDRRRNICPLKSLVIEVGLVENDIKRVI